MCAAPGGKTTHIAARMENTGRVVALDKSENKTRAIQRNCAQLGVTIVTTFGQTRYHHSAPMVSSVHAVTDLL